MRASVSKLAHENDPPMAEEPQQLSYEEAYAQLQEVLASLEAGDLPLEAALTHYELGAALAAYCAKKLDEAELRVRTWQAGNAMPLDGWQDA
jgi:exodeoxyribonuclease VII small subunit